MKSTIQTARTTAPSDVEISTLKEHPRQRELFDDLPEEELRLLADSMRNEQRQPIEILPDMTIVAGHQRVRAAKQLGWTEIKAIIRHDLAEKGVSAIEEHLIRDNLERRQLDPLGIARLYCHLRDIHIIDGRGSSALGQLQSDLSRRFGVSSRTLNRYARALRTPRAVQEAVSKGQLPLIAADRIAGLDHDTQEMIAQRIQDGEDPTDVFQDVAKPKQAPRFWLDKAVVALAKQVGKAAADLNGRIGEIPRNAQTAACLPALEAGIEMLSGIASRLRAG